MKKRANIIYGLSCKCHDESRIRYVGQTVQGLSERFSKHKYSAREGAPWPVSRWMAKHGIDNIVAVVIETFESKEPLDEAEKYWIAELKTDISQGGYNLWPGGGSHSGYKHPEDALTRIRGWHHTPETREKLRLAALGKTGELSRANKLTAAQVAEIKVRLWNGETLRAIASDYGVTKACISGIATGDTWPDIPSPPGERIFGYDGRFIPGQKPQNTKLTEEQVREIRRRYDLKEGCEVIAADFGITGGNVSMIGRRKTWKHVD